MATIVTNKHNQRNYVLLGTGFGAFESKKPNWFFGDLMADTSEGQYAMVCVCDEHGKIGWLDSSEVVVKSIDGQQVNDAFAQSI